MLKVVLFFSVCLSLNLSHASKGGIKFTKVPPKNVPLLTEPPLLNFAISSSYAGNCVLDSESVKCWAYESPAHEVIKDVPPLRDIKGLAAGNFHACAISGNRVICWGNNILGQTDVPKLINPKMISAGPFSTCAVDDTGTHCWGDNRHKQISMSSSFNRKVAVGFFHSCSITDKRISCVGTAQGPGAVVDLPLINPKDVVVGNTHTCALDDSGVKCWGANGRGQLNVPYLTNPKMLAAGGTHTCALDSIGVKCWGSNDEGQTDVPPLRNPKSISAGRAHSCAIDDEGVKCWGSNELPTIPEFNFGPSFNKPNFKISTLESSIDLLISASNPTRSLFYKNILNFISSSLNGNSSRSTVEQLTINTSRYVLLALLEPSILSGDSDYYLQKAAPAYKEDFRKVSDEFGVRGLHDIHFDSPLLRKTSLATIHSSIAVATEFLPTNQKQQLTETTKLLGIAMSNPDRGSILAALDSIQRNQSILDSLKSSSKTAFLPATIETAAAWLDKKVK